MKPIVKNKGSAIFIHVAKKNLRENDNCIFLNNSVHEMEIENNSMDFGYSLGVLHHITKSQEGLNACVSKIKPGVSLYGISFNE